MNSKILALLVGINNYNCIKSLTGCVDDIEKIACYLKQSSISCTIEKLLDEQATKSAIVNAFTRYAQTLQPEDSFLLYFSGHGTREHADPVWNETNESLECIVCYDEEPDKYAGYLLADKELRYLIHGLSKTGCHIAVVFDCCHAGGNTRNFKPVSTALHHQDVRERRYAYHFPRRAWNDFIFSTVLQRDDVIDKPVNLFLPQGAHVQIAACESDESALEVDGGGVFTRAFLQVLQDCGGNISYHALRSRVRQHLRFAYLQQPRIYAAGASDQETSQLLFSRFLNKDASIEQTLSAEAVYNKKKGWLLSLGAIHGVNQSTVVDLIDLHIPDRKYRFLIEDVFIDHSILTPAESTQLPPAYTVLRALVQGLAMCAIKLNLKIYNSDLALSKHLIEALSSKTAVDFILTEDEQEAQYCLHVLPQCLYITHPLERYRPLTEPVETSRFDDPLSCIRHLMEYLKHISQWKYIQQIHQPVATTAEEPIEVEITQVLDDGTEETILIDYKSGITCAKLKPFLKSSLRIRLTNRSAQKLFIAVAYLSYNFRVFTDLLEGKTALLMPGSSTLLRLRSKTYEATKRDQIRLQLPDVVQEYNWPGYTETLKIILSTEAFDNEALGMDALTGPYTLKDLDKKRTAGRSFDFEEDLPACFEGWTTQTIQLSYSNPFFNKVPKQKIEKMLAWDKMRFFAGGLYGRHPDFYPASTDYSLL